jgi:hypothetical protein
MNNIARTLNAAVFLTRVIYRVHSLLISGAVKEICPANMTKLGHITTIGKSYHAKSTSPSCWLSFAYSYGRYLLQRMKKYGYYKASLKHANKANGVAEIAMLYRASQRNIQRDTTLR